MALPAHAVRRRIVAALAWTLVAFLAAGCSGNSVQPPDRPSLSTGQASADQTVPARRNPARHARPPGLPDARLTPGDALPVSADDICTTGYSRQVRSVPSELKQQVYSEYGIASHESGEYEVDHLISLELGGSNSVRNLWPQSYRTTPWNARAKDRLEDRLHRLVCDGKMDLRAAQHAIASDWIAAYRKYVGPDPGPSSTGSDSLRAHRTRPSPASGSAGRGPEANASSDARVWVNTRSGVYWRPGTEYYGKTKEGVYMTQREAIRRGFHAPGRKHE
jgi:hypothetical protein